MGARWAGVAAPRTALALMLANGLDGFGAILATHWLPVWFDSLFLSRGIYPRGTGRATCQTTLPARAL